MAQRWGINIYVVWKTTRVSFSVCRAFFSYNPYLRDKSRSFLLTARYFVKNDHKLFVLKMAEGWGINIYFVWNTTIVPSSVCRAFLVIMYICVTNHVPFLLTVRYFVKNAYIRNFFLKMAECWGMNIYVVWKTTIISLSVCRAFFSDNPYLHDKSRSSLSVQGKFLSRNHDISNFFSKWRNTGV